MSYHFQNINGLKWSRANFPLTLEAIKNMAYYKFNVAGLVESNTEWELHGGRPLNVFKNNIRYPTRRHV
jgi:hypothetical protein